jgi:NTP pyrophosphatase (non-canonical NTP hydrolase)
MSSLSRQNILDDVSAERERQEHLKAMGKFPHTPADVGAMTAPEILAVLAEEFGEVAMLVSDAIAGRPLDPGHLREELVQVAAVCVAWVEGLDEEARIERNASYGWSPDAYVDEDGADCRNYATPPSAPARPTPAVLMYHDLYTDEELADAAGLPSSRRDWQRDPELGAE